MATANPFDLLGDDDNDDLSQLIAAKLPVVAADTKKPVFPAAQPAKPAKLPSKPLPPAQSGESPGMRLAVEVDVVGDVDMDEVAVVLVVSIGILMRIPLATMGFLEDTTDHLKRENQGKPLKGVAMVLPAVHSVVDAVVVLATVRLVKENVLEDLMNVAVELDVEMSLSGKVLGVGTGEHPQMKLLRRLRSLLLKLRRMLMLRSHWEKRNLLMPTRIVL
uniref:STM1-like N-terminal domain-containing protein n=1 Tax=Cannabis sativa TaxID=3483 RepID=A0A803RBJ2_CANSA